MGADRAHWQARNNIPEEQRWDEKHWRYLCRTHHIEEGNTGTITFCHKYGQLDQLKASGFPLWRIEEWEQKHERVSVRKSLR